MAVLTCWQFNVRNFSKNTFLVCETKGKGAIAVWCKKYVYTC